MLGLGLVCLARLCPVALGLSSLLRTIAYVEAVGLGGIVVTSVLEAGVGYDVMALLTGAVLAPMLCYAGARDVGRLALEPQSETSPDSSSAKMS